MPQPDIIKYLGDFKNPSELLLQLACCECLISGSRATAYFYKKLDVHSSDWDFFITYDMENIIAMARYLQNCQGVEWERPKTGSGINLWQLAILSNGVLPVPHHTDHERDKLRSISLEQRIEKLYARLSRNRLSRESDWRKLKRLTTKLKSLNVNRVTEETDYEAGKMHVLQGKIPANKRKLTDARDLKIQLIYQDQRSAMDCVFGFHSSIVQCVIAGFAAMSLYRESADGMAYYWQQNTVVLHAPDCGDEKSRGKKSKALPTCGNSCVSPCVEKYKRRGVTFISRRMGKHRGIDDGHSKVYSFSQEECLIEDKKIKVLSDTLTKITWVERDDSTQRTYRSESTRESEAKQVSQILQSLRGASENYNCSYKTVQPHVWLRPCSMALRYS